MERELHPEVRKAEQIEFPERDSPVVARTGERSGDDHIELIILVTRHIARVVIEPIMERVDGLLQYNDRGSEKICVTHDEVLAKLVRFIDCTCIHKRGEWNAQRVARKPDFDLRPWQEILAEYRRAVSDCVQDCIYRNSNTLGF